MLFLSSKLSRILNIEQLIINIGATHNKIIAPHAIPTIINVIF